jgi:hypothetical protein
MLLRICRRGGGMKEDPQMKTKFTRLFCTAALVALALSVVTPAFGQAVNDVYQLTYTNIGAGAGIRIINTGQVGSPIDPATKHGTVCADIYIFDANQEMLACCSCPLTANGLIDTLAVETLTGVTKLPSVVIKIVSDLGCSETAIGQLVPGALRAFATNPQPGGVTETLYQQAPLTSTEQSFLGNACSFVHYLGSGKGVCACPGEGTP